MILFVSKDEKELIERLRKLEPVSVLSEEILKLKREIASLEINKSKTKEDHDKQERELRHMIGLEKKRQEVEIEQARRETVLKVREENLKSERDQFEKNLKFNTERFEAMEKYLKGMMTDILARLPNISVELTKLARD